MLGDNYLSFESISLPNPSKMSVALTNVETTQQSQAGYDLTIVTRLQKRIFTLNYKLASDWKDQILQLCRLSEGTLAYNGEMITVKPRASAANLVEGSEYVNRTDGLWELTITFTEV